jgi:hypothetical protein
MIRLNLKRADVQGKLNSVKAADKPNYEAVVGVGRELAGRLSENERLKQIGSNIALEQTVTTMCKLLSDAEDFEALHSLAQTLKSGTQTSCRSGSCFGYSSNSVPCNRGCPQQMFASSWLVLCMKAWNSGWSSREFCSVFPSWCLLQFWLLWYKPDSERIVPR